MFTKWKKNWLRQNKKNCPVKLKIEIKKMKWKKLIKVKNIAYVKMKIK